MDIDPTDPFYVGPDTNFTGNNEEIAAIYTDDEIEAMAERIRKNDLATATKRSTAPVLFLTFIAGALTRVFGWDIDADDLLYFAPVVAVLFGIAYRVARELERKWPWFGRVFFFSSETPEYDDNIAI